MALITKIQGTMPNDLPPGDYVLDIVSVGWEGEDLVLTLKLNLTKKADTSHIKITKRAE